jgi:hypothetical protein
LGDIDRYFDEGIKPTGNVKFSLQETNDRFNAELATLTEENAREKILNVGTPSSILLACGIENKPIRLYGAKLLSKVRKHGYGLDDLKNLPLAMSEPIAVFNGSKPNSFAILTELRVGDNNILVALSVGKGGHDVDFNIISSVYDKRGDSVARWVNDGKMLWVDKKKALDYFSVSAPIAEAQNNQELISTANIIQNFENPKIETKFSLISPEMDATYLDAVERGDMETAQRMVMEAAEKVGYIADTSYQGSLAFNGAAPMANDYFETKDQRKEAWDNGDYEGTMSLGDYADSNIDTNDLEWQLTDRGNYRRAEDYAKESIDNINNTLKGDSHKITIYRAVPNNVEEGTVRNGDWVTPSRKYAEFHIGLQDWEGGRIIEQEVDIDNLWWNGDDINEWGYDDGSNYGYRNTVNNRKLLDSVTYDDAGNVIPLSERFNPRKEDIRYSLSNRPTGLLNDFAEEFESLQKEYESLDPTTIHAQHPFRIRKRKVVQKYLNYVSEVLGLPCEVFVLDSSNEQQMRTAYRKYESARLAGGNNKVSLASYNEFKEEVSDAIGEYFHGTNLVVINIGLIDAVNINSEYIGAVIHENGHKIIEGMNISEEIFEAIFEESQRLAPKQVEIINRRYPNTAKDQRGEELITFALQTRASSKDQKDKLMQFLEGDISVDDILDSFKISLPLRDKIIKDILIALQDGYNNNHNADYSNNRDNYGAAQEETFRNRRGSKYNGDSRRDILTPTRYALMDMPFFEGLVVLCNCGNCEGVLMM